jgi:acyl-[acyl-carrier-protein]-phospholipid O-acyltransferase / long-chain-fatty-acid--[acyl-carrier-protein] ligase
MPAMKDPSRVTRGFWALTVAQFLGAFNDNAWKTLLQLLAVRTVLEESRRDNLVALATALFTVPYLLFSMNAGALADRYGKRTVLLAAKIAEIGVTALGVLAFLGGSFWPLMGVLFLMAVHSTYYSPAKYGILPEILPEERLSWGNGIIEMTTFVAIILGTAAAAPLLYYGFASLPEGTSIADSKLWEASLALTVIAVLGCAASVFVDRVPPASPNRKITLNPLRDVWIHGRAIAKSRVLYLTVLGIVFFWALGALVTQNVLVYGKDVLHLEETRIPYLLTAMAGGIGLGSFVAGYLSGKTIELGLVPLGAIGMALSCFALELSGSSFGGTLGALAMLGVAGGIFIVPLNALLQQESPKEDKGSIIAASNVFTFAGMTLAAGVFWALKSKLALAPTTIFVVCGAGTLAVSGYVFTLLPEAVGRLVLWVATHTIYRVRTIGRENLPDRGPALLVANHTSYVDGLLVLATTHRFIRFVMWKAIADLPVVRPLARLMRVIPIAAEEGPKSVIGALKTAEEALRAGELVCIFPEGEISRTGQMLPFRKGFERIVRDLDVPIVPVHLDRVWGSIFSYQGGRFLWKRPKRIPYPVTVSFGPPLPSSATAFDLRQAVSELGSAAFADRAREIETLGRTFVRTARRHRRRLAMADSSGDSLTFGEALAKSIGVARRLRAEWADQERVGILLPPSISGALVNVAATLAGRVPVNLNFTTPPDTLQSAARQCELRTIVTSRAFLEKLGDKIGAELPARAIYLEDFAKPATFGERLMLRFVARFAPASRIERLAGATRRASPSDVATILFSSGSTAEPKGVMLTHANLLSNVQALEQLFGTGADDRVLGALPFFHSFGLTGTIWFPLTAGIGAVYHPSPFDARGVSEAVRRFGCTFLVATPTFLQAYVRRADPGAFGSLRYVVVGAERLTDAVADAFRERFGIEPLEGYGCTECSPLVAVNVPDFRERGIRQIGTKRGRIGHPVPGVSVRIVDSETFAPRPQGQEGLLLVKGPNVMAGYLGRPDLTAAAIRDGWYVTGDVAVIDEDGFVTITDRLSRFSKIAGEMVPHVKVEEALQAAAGATERVLAVTGLPDDQKGERLAVVHVLADDALAALVAKLPTLGLPNLWLPRAEAFVHVDALPILGTGKLDLRRVREIAAAALVPPAAAAPDPSVLR